MGTTDKMALTTVIADTIAEFKGKLDALMAESLSKYRVPASGDYTDGYGSVNICDVITTSLKELIFPTGIWPIHIIGKCLPYYGGSPSPFPIYIIDNYGNAYGFSRSFYNPGFADTNHWGYDWTKIVIGTDNYKYPLSNNLIDMLKVIINPSTAYILREHMGNQGGSNLSDALDLIKAAAKYAYEQAQYIATLEAELRALKAAAPPTEDLLGLTIPSTSPLTGAVIEAEDTTTQPQLIITDSC